MQHIPKHPWSLNPEELTQQLETHVEDGLSTEAVQKRVRTYGENTFESERTVSAFAIFVRQFKNPLVIVLIIAIAFTLVLGEWIDAGIISFAVLVNTLLGFIQEYKAERALADLRSYIIERTRVVREGKDQDIDSRTLVPGDILHLVTGDRVTADARLIRVTNLGVDEAILTGESLPVSKHTDVLGDTTLLADRENMVFAGTVVVEGSGYALVTHTGYETEIGRLAKLVAETKSEKTPLQVAIGKLAWVIIAVITGMVAIIFAMGIAQGQPLYDLLLLSIAIIVGAVPEALPIGLTAVLAIGVERIAKQKGIMRSLTAAETLGSTTLIITDKTGTLTQAKMELVSITPTQKLVDDTFDPEMLHARYAPEQKDILRLALLNSDVVIEDETLPPDEWKLSGSALEQNIVRASARHGITRTDKDRETVAIRIPFSSVYKFSVSQVSAQLLPSAYSSLTHPHVVVGAPDILLARADMDKETFLKAQQSIEALSNRGRRVLGVALVSISGKKGATLSPEDITDITFVGTLSFLDPVRPEVPSALTHIQESGVQVVMATGDLPGTARAIGVSLGWEIEDINVVTGEQLQQLTDEELLEMLPRVRIFARVTPADKVRVAQLYQKRGEVVAMTGDGVNDGPALKAANIGIAVGSGSDVAKSIADLVLLDDNFKTIVSTIDEGKLMLANIKKIFVYLMSNSLDEVILIGGSIMAGLALPITAVQIIWVNFFTGSIPAIAYAFDTQPVSAQARKSKVLFDSTVKFLTIGVGVVTSVLLFVLYYALIALSVPLPIAQSVIFVCFSSYILAVAFSFRNLEKPVYAYSLTENKPLFYGVLLGFVLIACTMYVPFFQHLFGTVSLSFGWLVGVALWLVLNIVLVEGAKWFARSKLRVE